MQNSDILVNGIRFVVLILVQVLLLNNINFMGFVNPYLYFLFILVFPLNGNKSLLIFLSFLLGLTIDMFGDSGGVHAAACVFIAFIRPTVLKFSFGVSYEYNLTRISKVSFGARLTYISIMALLHHVVLFSMEIFSTTHILLILKSTLFSGIFSVTLILCSLLLFSRKS